MASIVVGQTATGAEPIKPGGEEVHSGALRHGFGDPDKAQRQFNDQVLDRPIGDFAIDPFIGCSVLISKAVVTAKG